MISAEELRNARTAAGMTQPDLATKLGLSRDAIAKWERHGEQVPARREVAVAEALGDALAYVRDGEFFDHFTFPEWIELRAQQRLETHYARFSDPTERANRPHAAEVDPVSASRLEEIAAELSPAQVLAALRLASAQELADELVRRVQAV